MPDTFLESRPAAARAAEPPAAGPAASRLFPTVRRGYDPAVVDETVDRLEASLRELRAALSDAERRRELAEQHALAVEDEIRAVRAARSPEPESGFGARAERMLRLAESEATEVRAQAARSAGELLEHTQQEAERHRHETRVRLDTQRARAEEHLARRAAAAQEREDALRERARSVDAEAEAIRAAAARSADAHRAAAEADVRERRDRVAQEMSRARADAAGELARLRALRTGVQDDLRALSTALVAALAPPRSATPSSRPMEVSAIS